MADNTSDTTTGTEAGTTTTDTTNTSSNSGETSQNVAKNDPAKNKKKAGLTMAEPIRKMLEFKIKFPGSIKGVHTNQFCWIAVDDNFYDDFYGDIAEIIGVSKFARYMGFEKNRFYIEGVKTSFSLTNGIETELTLNPFASTYSEYMKNQQSAEKALQDAMNKNNGSGGGGSDTTGTGLVNMSGNDCTPTVGLAPYTDTIKSTKIGNSSANYATDTANMSGKEAILDIFNRFRYSGYSNNLTCPQKMWNKSGAIRGNCADISRLVKCVGDVHGMNVGIKHVPNHYHNLIEVNGKVYRFDCCFKGGRASSAYGGGIVNNLNRNGGPWC